MNTTGHAPRSLFGRLALSGLTRPAALFAVLWLAGASPVAAQTYDVDGRLYTPITGAQTQIDTNHTSSWNITVSAGKTFALVGGNFTIKRGPTTSADIVLTVHDGPLSTDTALATKSLTSGDASISNTFTPTLFTFPTQALLAGGVSGKTFLVTLTSTAVDTQSTAYFIKGGKSPSLASPSDRTVNTGIPPVATTSNTGAAANVRIVKTAPSTGTTGTAFDYSFTLTNLGDADANTSVTIEDQLPAGVVANSASGVTNVSSVSCTPSLPSSAGANLKCTVNLSTALLASSGNTATFKITATPSTSGTKTNYATVDPTGGSSPPIADSSCAPATDTSCSSAGTTVAAAANFTLAKTATSTVVTSGTITYTLKLGNSGGVTSGTSATVDDQLPTGASATAATAGTGVTSVSCTNLNTASAKLTCTVTLSAGIAASTAASSGPSFTLTVTAPSSAGSITNYASVDASGGTSPTTPSSSCGTANCSSAGTTVNTPSNITLAKTATDPVSTGGTITYTLRLGNSGGTTSGTSATVDDQLPTGVTATAVTRGTGVSSVTCTNLNTASAKLTCTVTLSSGIAASTATGSGPSFTVTATAPASAGSITNYASVEPAGGTSPAAPGAGCSSTSCSSASTTVNAAPNFTLSKTSTSPVVTGGTITYTLNIGNNGAAASGTTAVVDDQLPTGATATAATAGTGVTSVSCTNLNTASALVRCTATLSGALAAGAATGTAKFTLTVTAPSSAGSITNYASIDPSGGSSPATPGASCTGVSCASAATTVQPPPDMTIALSHTGSFTQGQAGVQYTATVTNSAATASSGTVTVTSTLPDGLTLKSASGSGWTCSVSGQTLTCTRSDALSGSQSYPPITITADVKPSATNLSVTASVSGGSETNTSNNSATDPTTIGAGPDLTLSKRHLGNFAVGQTNAEYTITVRNNGNSPTNGAVTVVDNLPALLTPTGAEGSGWSCAIAGQAVTCTRSDSLEPGASYPDLAIRVTVSSAATAGSVTNTASVSGGGDVNPDNNSASDATTITAGPDLTIGLTRSGTLVPGGTVVYTINSSNVGTGPTTGEVSITASIPPGATLVSVSGDGWSCSSAIRCTRTNVLSPGSAYPPITITVTLPATLTGSVAASAAISGGGDTTPGNSNASDSGTATASPDMTIRLSHSGNFSQGQVGAVYTITATNIGQLPTNGTVTVRDLLPAGLTATAFSGSGWSCSLSPLECSRTDVLAPGASYPALTLTVTVSQTAPASVTNTATVSGGGESNTGNNTASDVTAINVQVPDLNLTLSHEGDFVRGQVNGAYSINVSNVGQGPTIGGVTVSIALPTGIEFVSAYGIGWSCGQTCERADVLTPGVRYPTITVRVKVAANAPASLVTAAEVSGGADVSPGNNRATDATNIGEFVEVNFKITKVVDKPLLRPGDSAIFTVQALNTTNVVLEDVELTDSLPRGFNFLDGTSFLTILRATGQIQAADPLPPLTRARRTSSAAATAAGAAGVAPGGETALELPRNVEVPITPVVKGNLLTYAVGSLAPGETARIRYATLVGVDAKPGPQDTQVIGSTQSPLGPRLAAVPVQVQVIVLPSSFSIGQIAIGRVFEDRDDDGEVDRDEPGLQGVRVLLPTGESAITDRNGFYNLPAMANRSAAIALDPSTLPAGYLARRTGRGDGLVRLQRTPLNTGALLRQNFPVVRDPQAAPAVTPAANAAAATTAAPAVPPPAAPKTGFVPVMPITDVRITTAAAALPANGLARTVVTVSARDANGQPASGLVRLQTSAGQLLSAVPSDVWQGRTGATRQQPSNDPCATTETGAETPQAFLAATLQVVNGEAAVCLVSDIHPGVSRLLATALGTIDAPSSGAEATASVRFDTVDRPAMIVAVGELTVGYEVGDDEKVADAGVQSRGQFFYQDAIFGNSQLTVAMNSTGPVNGGQGGRLFQMDPGERTYPVFGDSSTRQELAQSNAKVYARFDRGRSHVMFGDLRGDTARQGLSGMTEVSRAITGFRAHFEPSDTQSYTAVVSRPDTVFRRDVFPLQQSGAVRLTRAPIVLGSETFTLEVRDRRNPEEVLRRELLVRSVDYVLDPLTGIVYFKRPLDLFDDALNLTNLVAAYEHLAVGLDSTAYQGRARGRVVGFELAGSVFSQDVAGATYVVAGADLTRALPNGGRLVAEMAQNHGASQAAADWRAAAGPTRTDSAFRVGVEQPFENGRTRLSGQFQRIGEFFQNPFGSPTLGGNQFVAAAFETTNTHGGTFRAALKSESNASALVDNSRTTLGAKWSQRVGDRVVLGGGLDRRSFEDNRRRNDIQSSLATLQGEWKPTARLSAMARREQNLGDADPTYPDQTVITGSYLLSPSSKLFVTQRLSDRPIVPISGIGAAELLSPLSTRETAIGIQSAVSSHTDVTSRMQLDRGMNGTDAFALVGTRTRIPVRKGFGLDWGFDRAQRVQGNGRNYTSGSVGVAYMPDERLRSSVSYELRSRETVGHAFAAGLAGRLGPGVTALLNYRFTDVGLGSALGRDSQALAALAWRPETSDRYGLLFSWSSGDRDQAILREPTASKVGRLSTDGYFAPGKGLELHSRLAFISSSGGALTESTTAYLYQGRLQQRIQRFIDVAAEGRVSWQRASSSRRTVLGLEIGAWVLPDLRVGLGYRTRALDQSGLPAFDTNDGGGTYFVLSSRLAGFFNLLGKNTERTEP